MESLRKTLWIVTGALGGVLLLVLILVLALAVALPTETPPFASVIALCFRATILTLFLFFEPIPNDRPYKSILLLIKSHEHEYQYLSYLLYDLLTNDSNDNIDTQDQITIFDSFSWYIKNYFRDAMKQTINYTNSLSLFDSSKIPLEQQICLLKANEKVKAKAMVKLKEVKAKSEDSGAKARQYLESLLKIPFGIYKIEPILNISKETIKDFCILVSKIRENDNNFNHFPIKINYNSVEVKEYSKIMEKTCIITFKENFSKEIYHLLTNVKRNEIISNVNNIKLLNKLNIFMVAFDPF